MSQCGRSFAPLAPDGNRRGRIVDRHENPPHQPLGRQGYQRSRDRFGYARAMDNIAGADIGRAHRHEDRRDHLPRADALGCLDLHDDRDGNRQPEINRFPHDASPTQLDLGVQPSQLSARDDVKLVLAVQVPPLALIEAPHLAPVVATHPHIQRLLAERHARRRAMKTDLRLRMDAGVGQRRKDRAGRQALALDPHRVQLGEAFALADVVAHIAAAVIADHGGIRQRGRGQREDKDQRPDHISRQARGFLHAMLVAASRCQRSADHNPALP